MMIFDYSRFLKEKKREVKKFSKKYNIKEDYNFGIMCERVISNDITLNQFDNYLTNNLYLNISEKHLNENFDSEGNLILLNETLSKYNGLNSINESIVMNFFKKIIAKIKNFLSKTLSKISDNKEKIMEMLAIFFDKIFSGLKMFGRFLTKNKKGIKTTLTKISVSLGITATVSYLLSFFGAGWAVAMGGKMGASVVGKVAGKKVVGEKNPQTQTQSQKVEESVKNTLMKLGKGIATFFKILRKFKIAILIFFGVVFILELIFEPIFAPILEIANMTNFTDVFSESFSVAATIPEVSVPENIEIKTNINIPGIKIEGEEIDADVGVEMKKTVTSAFNLSKSNMKENPQESAKGMAGLVNNLGKQTGEGDDITNIPTQNAGPLTDEEIEKNIDRELTDKEKVSLENIRKRLEHEKGKSSITKLDSRDTNINTDDDFDPDDYDATPDEDLITFVNNMSVEDFKDAINTNDNILRTGERITLGMQNSTQSALNDLKFYDYAKTVGSEDVNYRDWVNTPKEELIKSGIFTEIGDKTWTIQGRQVAFKGSELYNSLNEDGDGEPFIEVGAACDIYTKTMSHLSHEQSGLNNAKNFNCFSTFSTDTILEGPNKGAETLRFYLSITNGNDTFHKTYRSWDGVFYEETKEGMLVVHKDELAKMAIKLYKDKDIYHKIMNYGEKQS
jgi:hypothetical protein